MVEWKKFRKKPIEIEAYQTDKEELIKTREGTLKAYPGDYIIKGIEGEIYPCGKSIFEKTYDACEACDTTERLDDFDKEIIAKVNACPTGTEQISILWDYEDLDNSFISNRIKALARDGYIKRVSSHNHVMLYPVKC